MEIESPKEKRRVIAISRLKMFFRRLERNGMLTSDLAKKFIGDIVTLDAMAQGKFDESRLDKE